MLFNRPSGRILESGVLAGAELTLWRGTTFLFEELSFAVPSGTALLVEGPNGAGKTSLLRVIAGLTLPESGTITWRGGDFQEQIRAGRLRMAFSGHALALKPELSTRANLEFFARLAGLQEMVGETLALTGLRDCADLEVRQLSAGQKRRAALARILLSRAELWLLDEPQTNLDAAGRQAVEAAIRNHLGQGGTVVVAAHQTLDLGSASVSHLRLGDA
ncbi:MAG: heme ABC exporter ATP-binding protein CcmA [Chromatiales bacterium]|nr:heme ABC exporter ATP-binding protein CcmA [Chromatiales bacterium]